MNSKLIELLTLCLYYKINCVLSNPDAEPLSIGQALTELQSEISFEVSTEVWNEVARRVKP